MQIKLSREVKIAILVLLAGGFLVWGISFLKGASIFSNGTSYQGVYPSVEAINNGGPVNYEGFKIGYVKSIKLHPRETGKFLVTMVITEDLPVPDNSVAELYSVDIMGSKAIRILRGDSETVLAPGSTIQTSVSGDLKEQVSVEIIPLKNKTENMIVRLDTLLANLSSIFTDENRDGLNRAIKDFYLTMDNLNQTSLALNKAMNEGGSLANSLNQLESFSSALGQQSQNITATLENIASLSGELSQADIAGMLAQADSALYAISVMLDGIESGSGSLGKLVKDETLYLNMTDASANLDRLLVDVRQNPGRYVNISAFNIGRKIYISDDEKRAAEKGIVFKVKLTESKDALPIKNSLVLDNIPVLESRDGNKYIYTAGQSSSYSEVLKWKDKLILQFPEAEIYPLENGVPVSERKALRKIEIKE
ncbi:MAG TPA: MCE family protein [Marinilabiliaceae bacterium]|nr:MCE family protein [Marinilabiliaceae bacterium]